MKQFYILMADIIGSRSKNSRAMMRGFRELVAKINAKCASCFWSPLTITLGDEFQGVVKSLPEGIEVVFKIEEIILERELDFSLRYVLNFGPIDTKINRNVAYGMVGEGLTETRKLVESLRARRRNRKHASGILGVGLVETRQLLEILKSKKRRFLIRTADNDLSDKLSLAFFVFQSLWDDWSLKDRHVAKEFLHYGDYKKIAKRLNKDASLIWRKRKSLKIIEIQAIIKLIELIAEAGACPK